MYAFHTKAGTWREVSRLPEPRHLHAVAYMGDCIYVVGEYSTHSEYTEYSTHREFTELYEVLKTIVEWKVGHSDLGTQSYLQPVRIMLHKGHLQPVPVTVHKYTWATCSQFG